MAKTSEPLLVTLRDGPPVPAAVLTALWNLEARGATFTVQGDTLTVRPREVLTDTDRALLRDHKPMVLAVLDYCDRIAPL